MNKTVLQKIKPLFVIVVLVLVVINFIPVITYSNVILAQSPTEDDLITMDYIRQNTPVETTILSTIQEGHLITSQSKRSNFFDTNFIFAPQANQRYADARTMFLSKSQNVVINQMNYYGIDYIYLSSQTQTVYPTTTSIFETGDCFELLFNTTTTKLFENKCKN